MPSDHHFTQLYPSLQHGNTRTIACSRQHTFLIALTVLILVASGIYFYDPKPESQRHPTPIAVSPFDLVELKELVGREVIFEGEVLRAGQSQSGKTRYLNFAMNPGQSAFLAFQVSQKGIGNVYTLDRLKHYEGKRIQAKGKLLKLHGHFQVFIRHDRQLRLLPEFES